MCIRFKTLHRRRLVRVQPPQQTHNPGAVRRETMTEQNPKDKAVYKTDFTQEDWKKWIEELESQPPPPPPKLTFYSVEALNNYHKMMQEYFDKHKKP